jgi:signal transduction histidine kinase
MSATSTILVVDDTDASRFVKIQTLRRAGFRVIDATTGADALAQVARERPDLLVLDVNLPDMTGFEVTRRLREVSPESPALPILQVSATAISSADRVRGLDQGADVYLVEPVDAEVLVATVQALLRARRAEVALAAALERERRARKVAEEADRLKNEFIATLSHELRTPLNAVMGWIWQLQHTKLSDEARARALESLERNSRMQAQLINDLLDVSRASRGKLQLEMRLVDLKNVVTAAAESVSEAMERKHLDLQLRLQPAYVAGDEARLQQIVTNLLTNAVQFTPIDGRITVTLRVEDGDAVLSVEDTGAGIDPSFVPFVFDQFRQGEAGLARKHSGLGLGLAVVKQLVTLHDGSVTVASEGLGRGATFTVRLPRENASAADLEQGSPVLLKDLRVLLITDDGVDTMGVKPLLEYSGAVVRVSGPFSSTSSLSSSDGTALHESDVIVSARGEEGPLTLAFPGSRDAEQAVPRTVSPSQIVRRIARMVMHSRT